MKKKILFCADALYGGGAEKVLQTLLGNLDYDKFEIFLLSVHEEKLIDDFSNKIKYSYIFRRCTGSFFNRISGKLLNRIKLFVYYHFSPSLFYRLFITGKYDVEVAFIEGYSTRIISGSTNVNSKKYAWVHIDLEHNHWTKVAYKNNEEECISYSMFSEVLCVSNSVKEATLRLFPNIQKISVIYNPIDEIKIKKMSVYDVGYEYLEDCFNFISIGRLVAQKGYDRLLPILKKLRDDGYNFVMRILGEGDDQKKLEQYILDNNLQNNIKLLGYINQPYSYLYHSDLFICSSRSEGYSTVITEALILGVPVIATNCAGMQELLGNNNQYGLIVDNDENALYQGIKEMINDREVLLQWKLKAMSRANSFSLSNLMQQVEQLLLK